MYLRQLVRLQEARPSLFQGLLNGNECTREHTESMAISLFGARHIHLGMVNTRGELFRHFWPNLLSAALEVHALVEYL